MSKELVEVAKEKYEHALNKEERTALEKTLKLDLLRDMFYEFACATCGAALHQIERPEHIYSYSEIWHSLACPACREVTLICLSGAECRITVVERRQVNALMQNLISSPTIVCPEHGNEVKVLTVRPSSERPVTAIVKHAACPFQENVGIFRPKMETKYHSESKINLLRYESHLV